MGGTSWQASSNPSPRDHPLRRDHRNISALPHWHANADELTYCPVRNVARLRTRHRQRVSTFTVGSATPTISTPPISPLSDATPRTAPWRPESAIPWCRRRRNRLCAPRYLEHGDVGQRALPRSLCRHVRHAHRRSAELPVHPRRPAHRHAQKPARRTRGRVTRRSRIAAVPAPVSRNSPRVIGVYGRTREDDDRVDGARRRTPWTAAAKATTPAQAAGNVDIDFGRDAARPSPTDHDDGPADA